MLWFLLALSSGFCAALLAIIIKLYLKNINPLFVTFLFSFIVVVMIIILDYFTKVINCPLTIKTLTSKEWMSLIFAGFLNGIAFTFYVSALKCGNASGVVAVDRLGILFVVILSIFFLNESFTIKSILGATMMIVGAAFLST